MSSNFIAILGVHQSTSDITRQANLYGTLGFHIDESASLEDGEILPDEWFAARGVNRDDLLAVHAMKLPADPYMHVYLYSWKNLITESRWPQAFNQIGSRGISLHLDDVHAELNRLRRDFPDTRILQEPIPIDYKWGRTMSALVQDPEGTWVELVSIENNPLVAQAKAPSPGDRSFLHFMLNCLNFEETSAWYTAFGMTHDGGVDFRPEVGFNQGYDYFMDQMKVYRHWDTNMWQDCHFLRGERDPSHMHLELLKYNDNGAHLKDPGLHPTWYQKGIARYCIKTPDYASALADAKKRGYKIYIDEQRGCLVWGDSQWFYFGDVDGNILTLEQWFPHRYWGERM
ncbi:hypothetical protein FE257_010699 [Aspergillus nanangensis]|uniref:VOC domain-containing protein n=1 Tax=Aspergillus nanangensis TaxID=2582783 RepID=A0AAD4CIR6_ASPNN|nr:hypothetical protein FE257_010699 [Aspergillus nanangensis]